MGKALGRGLGAKPSESQSFFKTETLFWMKKYAFADLVNLICQSNCYTTKKNT